MLRRLKDLLRGRKKREKPAEVEVTRQSTRRADYDRMMEAVTFAEAGLTDYAQEVMRRHSLEPRKILVVEQGLGLTPAVMEYALDLAERLRSALVILNVAPALGAGEEPLPLYKQHLRNSLAERVRQAAQGYRQRAATKGIALQHLVKFSDLKTALTEVNREIRRIELVIASREVKLEKLEAGLSMPVFQIT